MRRSILSKFSVLLVCSGLMTCLMGCNHTPIIAKPQLPEAQRIGIAGYSDLSTYAVTASDQTQMRNLLGNLFPDLTIPSEEEVRTIVTAEPYSGWYAAQACEVYRTPSEQPLPDSGEMKRQADEIIQKIPWDEVVFVLEEQNDTVYHTVCGLQLQQVPINGAQIDLWLDADGLQRLSIIGWPGSLEKQQAYDLTNMMDASGIFQSSNEQIEAYAKEKERRLPRTGTPELVYTASETQDELLLAWKITFEESYQNTNGEETRVPGYYLLDAVTGDILDRVEEEAKTGRIDFRDWNALIGCMLGPDAEIDISEAEDGAGLQLSVWHGDDTYTGSISTNKFLKFQRTSTGIPQWLPSDEDIFKLRNKLMEALHIEIASDPLMERDTEELDVYFYFGTMQNNSVYLRYDAYGLQSVEMVAGEVLRSVQDPFDLEYESLPSVGVEHTTIEHLEAEAANALQQGGMQIIVSAELPETPKELPIYTAEFTPVDSDAILRTVFGENALAAWEEDSTGRHFLLETEQGTYAGAETGAYLNIGRISKEAVPCTEKEAAALGEQLRTISQLNHFSKAYEKFGISANGQIRLSYPLQLEGVPVSEQSFYSNSKDQAGYGTCFQIEYDANGLSAIHIQQPVLAHRTAQREPNLISAKEAVEIVENSMKQAAGNMVQVICDVELNYLNPIENGEQMIPVWKVGYDTIRFAINSATEVDINSKEYAYLVDARTGQLYSYH